jgi:hypothetical protein
MPTAAVAGQTIGPFTVDIEAQNGAIVTTDDSYVTLSLQGGSAGALLEGAATQQAVNGVATFNNLSINASGSYSFMSSNQGLSATSSSISILPPVSSGAVAAPQLAFVGGPNSTVTGQTIPTFTVDVEDQSGNVVSTDNSQVTLFAQGNKLGALLNGTVIEPAVNGVATFSGLSFNEGGSYTLGASDGTDTPAASDTFSIGQLVVTQQPVDVAAGAHINVVANVETPGGSTISSDDSNATLTIKRAPPARPLTEKQRLPPTVA